LSEKRGIINDFLNVLFTLIFCSCIYKYCIRSEKKEPEGPPPEVGVIYRNCVVKGVHNFGVFVEILPGYEGLIHISELDIKKVLSPEKAGITVDQKLDVKYLGKNEKGQMRLSRRVVLLRDAGKDTGEPPAAGEGAAAASAAVAPKVTAASAEASYS
jgi:predicted RNA-binding protein with RPS1 domain